MSSRSKQHTRLINDETGELIVSADLTPAAAKRIIKEYARFGYYLKPEYHLNPAYELAAAI
jgi:hypothetical protein